MQKFAYLDKKRHGTVDFPVEYYYVDSAHPRYNMAFHWHNEWELLRVIRGELALTLDDEPVTLRAGDIVLIASETLHGGAADDCVYECLVFDLYGLFGKIDMVKSQLRPFYRKELLPDRFFTNADDVPSRALDIFSGGASPCALDILSTLAGLFSWIISEKRYRSTAATSRGATRIRPVLEYIEAHYGETLSLDTLAEVAGMNARYFCKLFSSLTHTTPMNYVNFYRIEQATFLLDSTDMTITQIAANCGFWESSYFTKVFKKFKGTTPQKHRKEIKNMGR